MKKRASVRKLALNKETIAVLVKARDLKQAGADYTATYSCDSFCASFCRLACYNAV